MVYLYKPCPWLLNKLNCCCFKTQDYQWHVLLVKCNNLFSLDTLTHLCLQLCLHWGYLLPVRKQVGWLPSHRLPLYPLPLLLPRAAWRTAVAGPSSVTLYGPAGSEISAEPLWTCIAAAGSSGFQRERRRAVRWPQQSAALHCSHHQEELVQKPQLHQDWGMREQQGQGWGTLSLGWQVAGGRRAWLILALKNANNKRV